jgi:hypothetical protein
MWLMLVAIRNRERASLLAVVVSRGGCVGNGYLSLLERSRDAGHNHSQQ